MVFSVLTICYKAPFGLFLTRHIRSARISDIVDDLSGLLFMATGAFLIGTGIFPLFF